MQPNKSFLSLTSPRRDNLSTLFKRAAKWLFVLSYLFGLPWKTTNPTPGQEAMAIYGIVALCCWMFHLAYRDKRP